MREEIKRELDNQSAVALLLKILAINTANPPGNEKDLALVLERFLADQGFETCLDDLGNNRANLTARLRGTGQCKALFLNGHLDVVPPGDLEWNSDPFLPLQTGERIFARGACDMKAGVSAIIHAAMAIKQAGLPLRGDLILSFTADEETGGTGSMDYLERHGFEDVGAILIAEPTSGGIKTACKGLFWVEIVVSGQTAHGSRPELGVNAIVGMSRLINKLLNYDFKVEPHPILGLPSLNIAMIDGGVKVNVVPDRCRLMLDIRTLPGMSHALLVKDFEALCGEVRQTMPGLQTEIKIASDYPPLETDPTHPLVQMARSVIQEEFQRDEVPSGFTGCSDMVIFVPPTGLPNLFFGPGDLEMAHQPNEYVDIPQLVEATAFYAAMIERYLG